jgi:putative NIF3 family GTP cyclohydrolase 1 type 2
MKSARPLGCDVLVTGEARFHAHLEARELGFGLIVAGHYQTERPAVEWLAQRLQVALPSLQARSSQAEHDPVQWV